MGDRLHHGYLMDRYIYKEWLQWEPMTAFTAIAVMTAITEMTAIAAMRPMTAITVMAAITTFTAIAVMTAITVITAIAAMIARKLKIQNIFKEKKIDSRSEAWPIINFEKLDRFPPLC